MEITPQQQKQVDLEVEVCPFDKADIQKYVPEKQKALFCKPMYTWLTNKYGDLFSQDERVKIINKMCFILATTRRDLPQTFMGKLIFPLMKIQPSPSITEKETEAFLKEFEAGIARTLDVIEIWLKGGILSWVPPDQVTVNPEKIPLAFSEKLWKLPLPMVAPPLKITDNFSSGYYTTPLRKTNLVHRGNPKTRDINLDALNIYNAQKLFINPTVLYKKDGLEGEAKRKILQRYITEFNSGIWLTHFFDFRLRMYTKGWQLTNQGDDEEKAAILLDISEPVNERGLFWLENEISNQYGHGKDKITYEEKSTWVKSQNLLELVEKGEAENPEQFFRACKAYKGYEERCVVSLDAVSSGIQLLSTLTGDVIGLKNTGVLKTNERPSPYLQVEENFKNDCRLYNIPYTWEYSDIKQKTMIAYYGGESDAKKLFGLAFPLFMNAVAKVAPRAWALSEMFAKLHDPTRAEQHWIMPDGAVSSSISFDYVSATVTVGGIPQFISKKIPWPKKGYKGLSPHITHSCDTWVFREILMMTNQNQIDIEKKFFPTSNPVKAAVIPPMVKKLLRTYARTNILSSRILLYADASMMHLIPQQALEELIQALPKKKFPLLGNHDCFSTHPNYMDDIVRIYNYLLERLYCSSLVAHIHAQLGKKDFPTPPIDLNLKEQFKHAKYALN